MSRQRSSRQETKIKRVYAVVVALLVVSAIATGLLALRSWEQSRGEELPGGEDDTTMTVYHNGSWYRLNDRLETVLVMGLDKFDERASEEAVLTNDRQTDFLMLMVMDREKKICTPIHINRDTMGQIHVLGLNGENAGSFVGQLALAHTYGTGQKDSCRNTVRAVSELLYEVPVDYYVSLTMDAVGTLNDLAGGVTVTVMDDFSGIDDTLVQGQNVTLMGEHALTYVRSRSGLADSSNLHRMERQRQYLQGLFTQCMAKVKGDDLFLLDAVSKIGDSMMTDCTDTKLQELFERFEGYEIAPIQTIEGESKVGERFMEFYPDEDALKEQVIALFFQLDEKK